MSLYNIPSRTRKLLRDAPPQFIVWKMFRIKGQLLFPLYFDRDPVQLTRAGYLHSGINKAHPCMTGRYVSRGIHVYTTYRHLERFEGNPAAREGCIAVACAVHKRDLIASDNMRAVFSKVQIPASERTRLMYTHGVKL